MDDLSLCGWRLRSEISFPELGPWRGGSLAPDVEMAVGSVPDRLENLVLETPFLQISADRTCRLEIPTVAAYLIRSGREIVVAPRIDPTAAEIRNFVLGPVLGLLCHQRGAVPLHAAAVNVGGTALALAGPSRCGKSTLAAAFARRGHGVLADDICAIDMLFLAPAVLPTSPHLRLWRDACEGLSLTLDNPEPVRVGQGRYLVSQAGAAASDQAVPLRTICLLVSAKSSGEKAFTLLTGEDAAAAIATQIYGHAFADAFGAAETLTRRVASVAQTAAIMTVSRPFGFEDVDDIVRRLEEIH